MNLFLRYSCRLARQILKSIPVWSLS